MTNLLFLLVFPIVLVFLSFLYSYSKRNKSSVKKTIISQSSSSFFDEYDLNPDLTTDNWDLHKLRLKKFRRSQYKGLTFFMSSENRIYYLSEKGAKVYC